MIVNITTKNRWSIFLANTAPPFPKPTRRENTFLALQYSHKGIRNMTNGSCFDSIERFFESCTQGAVGQTIILLCQPFCDGSKKILVGHPQHGIVYKFLY